MAKRFLRPDAYFFEQPDEIVRSPIEGGLYGYTGNDPVNYIDPTGEFACLGFCVALVTSFVAGTTISAIQGASLGAALAGGGLAMLSTAAVVSGAAGMVALTGAAYGTGAGIAAGAIGGAAANVGLGAALGVRGGDLALMGVAGALSGGLVGQMGPGFSFKGKSESGAPLKPKLGERPVSAIDSNNRSLTPGIDPQQVMEKFSSQPDVPISSELSGKSVAPPVKPAYPSLPPRSLWRPDTCFRVSQTKMVCN